MQVTGTLYISAAIDHRMQASRGIAFVEFMMSFRGQRGCISSIPNRQK